MDANSQKRFQTKHQLLHRLQEGVAFGDGIEYTVQEYQEVSSRRTKEWKDRYYPESDLLGRHAVGDDKAVRDKLFTPENLERDYWDIVETHTKQVSVEYGNDVDTTVFGSGFPLSERGRSVHGTKNLEKMKLPEPKFGSEDFYKETYWNLNNMPFAPDSALRHVKVGINGINVPWLYYGSLFTVRFFWHFPKSHVFSQQLNTYVLSAFTIRLFVGTMRIIISTVSTIIIAVLQSSGMEFLGTRKRQQMASSAFLKAIFP